MIRRMVNGIRDLRKIVRYLCQKQLLTAKITTKDDWKIFLLNIMPRRLSLRKERNFNFEDCTKEEKIKKFRMSKSEINYIYCLITDLMQPVEDRSIDLSLEQKVLIYSKTLGSGSFQNCSKTLLTLLNQMSIKFLVTSLKLWLG